MASIGLKERLALLVTADTDSAVRGLQKMERAADRSIGKTTDKVDKLGIRLTKMGASMVASGVLVAAGLSRAVGAASDLNESVGQTEQIFGDAADEISRFAKDALGLSERKARDATSEFGLLLKNFEFGSEATTRWSEDLTTLAVDMASFKNTTTADAITALGSALRGESEPIRRYGVMLDDASVRLKAVELGLADTTAEVDNNGKAQGRLALIMEQTADLQGDFTRTQDGVANSTRQLSEDMEDFQAAIGQAVLPVMQDLLGAGKDLLGWYNDLDPATQNAISQAAVWGTGLLLAGGAVSMTAGALIKMRSNLQAATVAIRAMSAATLASGVGAVAAVAALVGAMVILSRRNSDVGESFKSVSDAMTDVRNATAGLAGSFDKQTVAVTDATREMVASSLATAGTLEAVDALGFSIDDLIGLFGTVTENGQVWGSELDTTITRLEDSGQLTEEQAAALLSAGKAFADAEMDARAMNSTLGNLADTTDETTVSIEELSASFGDLVDLFIAGTASVAEGELAIERFGEKARALRDDNGDLTQSLAESRVEFFNMADQVTRNAEAMAEAGVPAQEIAEFVTNAKDAVIGFGEAAQLKLSDIREVGFAMDSLNRTVVSTIDVRVVGDQIPSQITGGQRRAVTGVGFRARGGPVSAGRPYVVGERGPEIMVPGVSGTVVPNRAITSSTQTIVLKVELDGQVLAEAVANTGRFSGGTIR